MNPEPSTLAALDQFEAMTTAHAKQVGCYYRELVASGIPTETAADLASELARSLRKMALGGTRG